MPTSTEETILRNYGDLEQNRLETIIHSHLEDDEEIDNISLSSSIFFTHETKIQTLTRKEGNFNILSLNCHY